MTMEWIISLDLLSIIVSLLEVIPKLSSLKFLIRIIGGHIVRATAQDTMEGRNLV